MSIAGIVTQLGTIDDIVTRGLLAGEAIETEVYSGGFADYGTLIERKPKFKARNKDEEEVKPILEDIAEQIAQGPGIDTRADIEIVLRMRLRQQHIKYKNLYLKWLNREARLIKEEVHREIKRKKAKKRKREEMVIILSLMR